MEKYATDEFQEALRVISSTIHNCEKIKTKFPEGSSQHSLLKNRIKALIIAKALITEGATLEAYSTIELLEAQKPIGSIIDKCETGQRKHDQQSSQYKRFQKLIDVMTLAMMLLRDAIASRG